MRDELPLRLRVDPAALPSWNIKPVPVVEKPPELPPDVRLFVEATRPRSRYDPAKDAG